MRFMEEVSAFTKGVGQKAKGNYDIVTMNGKVSSLSKEIRTLYTQIGETYYNIHKEDSEEAFSGMVEKIKGLEANIADIQQQIEATRTATAAVSLSTTPSTEVTKGDGSHGFCEKCGVALLADSMFCVKCGAPVSSQKTEEQKTPSTE